MYFNECLITQQMCVCEVLVFCSQYFFNKKKFLKIQKHITDRQKAPKKLKTGFLATNPKIMVYSTGNTLYEIVLQNITALQIVNTGNIRGGLTNLVVQISCILTRRDLVTFGFSGVYRVSSRFNSYSGAIRRNCGIGKSFCST